MNREQRRKAGFNLDDIAVLTITKDQHALHMPHVADGDVITFSGHAKFASDKKFKVRIVDSGALRQAGSGE